MATKNPNMISFGPNQQDLQAQQMELQRRQQFADMLRQQALTPIDQQMVSGRVVPNSPWLGATKLAQALLARDAEKGNVEAQAEIGKMSAKRQAEALQSLAPAGTFDEPQQLGMGLTSESVDAAPKVDAATKQRWQRLLAANQVDPQLGRDLLKNELSLTDEQKNMLAQGIDPSAFGKARLAKEQAGGLMNVAPGTSVLNAGTGQFQAAAPDFGTGIQGQFGPNGPQVSRIQGADIIPQIAGEKARAEAGGRAAYNLITVNTPNGPVLVTEEQAAQMAGGGRQPNAPVQFTASNGVSIDTRNKNPQQLFQAAQASGDPQVMQAVQEWASSAPSAGIPLMSEAEKERQVGAVRSEQEISKNRVLQAQAPEQLQKITDARSVVSLLDMADPILGKATGSSVGAMRDKLGNIIGKSTESSQAAAQLAAIGGALVAKMPKMSGPQSDKDVQLYREMAGQVGDPSIPAEQKKAAMQVIRMINRTYASENSESVANKALIQNLGASGSQVPTAPANAPKIRRYNPTTGRIE